MATVNEKVQELVKVVKELETLEQQEKDLRTQVKDQLPVGTTVVVDGYVVEHKLVRKTITDPAELNKIDPSIVVRATVTTTKLSPEQIKIIGEKEGKKVYYEEPGLFVKKGVEEKQK
jgi:predicted phage-related endonuclease